MADVDNLLALYGNSNITNSSGQQVSAKGSVFEMARYFNFNTSDTDEVTISFVLFNTIVKNGVVDQWKRNLYFISLFNLRNLPFKLDYTTYLPPLLYDVIIPGVKRLPFAYVSSFSAVPQGMIRNMKIENFLAAIAGVDTNENKQISTPVPEAWTISITFKSMIARTANLMLAGGADLPITINMSESNAADKDKSLAEYKQMMKEMEEERQRKAAEEEAAKQKAAEDKAKNTNPVYEFISKYPAASEKVSAMVESLAEPINKLLYGDTEDDDDLDTVPRPNWDKYKAMEDNREAKAEEGRFKAKIFRASDNTP